MPFLTPLQWYKLHVMQQHAQNDDQRVEIGKVTLGNQCKKHAATCTVNTLREIFDEETRDASAEISRTVIFTTLQSAMYKRRRLSLQSLPTVPDDADEHIEGNRFAIMKGSVFFRGKIEAAGGSAIMFANDEQLALLSPAKRDVCIDATFKTVPSLYYQLFTLFANVDKHTFPVFLR
jgi:hypothetical protein